VSRTDFAGIAAHLNALPAREERYLVAIAGPPASGKSTFSEELAEAVAGAAVVPMDGFHLDNDVLIARGLLAQKGAPQTFDVEGFRELLPRLQVREDVAYPTFDRGADCVVPGGGVLAAEARLALVEGNYLLLDEGDWAGLEWDVSVWLDVPRDVLETRLMARWLGLGLSEADVRIFLS